MLTWKELLNAAKPGTLESVMVQCIATISTHPNYRQLTPEEVWDRQVQYAQEVQDEVRNHHG
jgi:hypothetical protein